MTGLSPAQRRPAPLYLTVFATLVILGTIAGFIYDRKKVRTGELLIQADAADVRVSIRKEGRMTVPPTDKRSFVLRPGSYRVALEAPDEGFRLEPESIAIVAGRRTVVRVRAETIASPRERRKLKLPSE